VSAAATPRPWGRWSRQAWAVALHDFRRLAPNARQVGRYALLLVPVAVAALLLVFRALAADTPFEATLVVHGDRVEPSADLRELAGAFRFPFLMGIFYLAAASLFGNLYHAEMSERTLHHLFLQPVRREVTTAGKYLAGVLTLTTATTVSWWLASLTFMVSHGASGLSAYLLTWDGLQQALGFPLVLLLGSLAYGALFMLFGALLKAPMGLAAMFWGWERLTLFLPVSFQRVSITYWLASLMPVHVQADSPLTATFEPAPVALAVPVLLLVAATFLALSVLRVRRLELHYGAAD
jgi:hypothetical protein